MSPFATVQAIVSSSALMPPKRTKRTAGIESMRLPADHAKSV
jgi:hypothetical protein